MASKNKKNKAKNSYLMRGADRLDLKMKRIAYYTTAIERMCKTSSLFFWTKFKSGILYI